MGLVGHSQLPVHTRVQVYSTVPVSARSGTSGFRVREMQGYQDCGCGGSLGFGGLDFHLNLFLDRLRCVGLPVWYCL